MSLFLWSQIVGAIAFSIFLIAVQFKKRTHILSLMTLGATLFALQYYLLGDPLTACIVLISASRYLISIFSTHKSLFYLYVVVAFGILYVQYQSIFSLLPFLAFLFNTVAAFQTDDKPLRIHTGIATALWFSYNIIIHNYIGLFIEGFFFLSNLIGYWRFYIRKK